MVKIFLILACSALLLFANEDIQPQEDLVLAKVQTLIDQESYTQNQDYINIIFSPRENYLVQERVDAVKVVETLKANGLLNMFYPKPSELWLNFKTSGSPLFFVKIMGDTLRNIGYYRYTTKESNFDASEFSWSISLTAEYATDPLVLQNELLKHGCEITDVVRENAYEWTYIVDMRDGHLNTKTLKAGEKHELRRSLYAHWLDVSHVKKLRIVSSGRNSWYPNIAYYDASLHLLKVVRKNVRTKDVTLQIPRGTKYIKISDLYTLKNLKDPLVLSSIGSR